MKKEIPTTEGIAIVHWCCPVCGTLNEDDYYKLEAYDDEINCQKCKELIKVEV